MSMMNSGSCVFLLDSMSFDDVRDLDEEGASDLWPAMELYGIEDSKAAPEPSPGAGQPQGFNPQPAWNLLQAEPEDLEWTWHGFIPRGTLCLLVAYMKTGKSTLAYDLALAVSRGVPFLGFQTQPGGVLLIALEERRQDVLFRLRDFGLNAQDPVWINGPPLAPSSKLYNDIRSFHFEEGNSPHHHRLALPLRWAGRRERQ